MGKTAAVGVIDMYHTHRFYPLIPKVNRIFFLVHTDPMYYIVKESSGYIELVEKPHRGPKFCQIRGKNGANEETVPMYCDRGQAIFYRIWQNDDPKQ